MPVNGLAKLDRQLPTHTHTHTREVVYMYYYMHDDTYDCMPTHTQSVTVPLQGFINAIVYGWTREDFLASVGVNSSKVI